MLKRYLIVDDIMSCRCRKKKSNKKCGQTKTKCGESAGDGERVSAVALLFSIGVGDLPIAS